MEKCASRVFQEGRRINVELFALNQDEGSKMYSVVKNPKEFVIPL